MKSMIDIEKRLGEIAKKSRKGPGIDLQYCSPAASLAQTLTGELIQTPDRREMTWGNGNELKPVSDAMKLRWLEPYKYRPEQLDEIRREWETSPHERDKAALKELDRLESMLAQDSEG